MRVMLRDILVGLRDGRRYEYAWLYLPAKQDWTLDTAGLLIDADVLSSEDIAENGVPKEAADQDCVSTLDTDTIEDIVEGATLLQKPPGEDLLLEAFLYYYKHDGYLPQINAPEPPSPEESMLRRDREFYDLLGPEQPGTKCKSEGCTRGAVKMSVLCRRHHFESIRSRPCPFDD